jgi:hypothetical protein
MRNYILIEFLQAFVPWKKYKLKQHESLKCLILMLWTFDKVHSEVHIEAPWNVLDLLNNKPMLKVKLQISRQIVYNIRLKI